MMEEQKKSWIEASQMEMANRLNEAKAQVTHNTYTIHNTLWHDMHR